MLKRTLQIFGLAFLFGLCLTLGAHAGVNLKKVQVSEGNQVHLIFDQKINPSQIKVEYLRDIIQLSLNGVSVYPAKVSTVSGSDLSKVFAYQYSPDLVRCRLTVAGDATRFQGRVQMKVSGKTVSVRLARGKSDQVAASAAAAIRDGNESESPSSSESASEKAEAPVATEKKVELSSDEKQLLDRVMRSEEGTKAEKIEKVDRRGAKDRRRAEESRRLTSGKGLPTPTRSLGMMLFIFGLLGAFLMFLKKAKGQGSLRSEARGLSKFLSKLTGGASRDLIQVVATHHLAPKKSIVMVKIQGRMLVLGMTNDSVNLITEFKATDEENEVEEQVDVRDFAEGLKKLDRAQTGSQAARDEMNAFAGILTKAFNKSVNNAASPAGSGPVVQKKPAGATAAGSAKPAINAYQATRSGPVNEAAFDESPALSAALKQEGTKTSIRAQIRSKVERMKSL